MSFLPKSEIFKTFPTPKHTPICLHIVKWSVSQEEHMPHHYVPDSNNLNFASKTEAELTCKGYLCVIIVIREAGDKARVLMSITEVFSP